MREKEFIPKELSLELKQLGFNEPCLAFYDGKNAESFYFNNIRDASGDYIPFQKHDRLKWFGALLYQQAFRWFREKHQLIHYISWVYKKTYDGVDWFYQIKGINMINNNVLPHEETRFGTYEEAELECLKKLIELVKENNK